MAEVIFGVNRQLLKAEASPARETHNAEAGWMTIEHRGDVLAIVSFAMAAKVILQSFHPNDLDRTSFRKGSLLDIRNDVDFAGPKKRDGVSDKGGIDERAVTGNSNKGLCTKRPRSFDETRGQIVERTAIALDRTLSAPVRNGIIRRFHRRSENNGRFARHTLQSLDRPLQQRLPGYGAH